MCRQAWIWYKSIQSLFSLVNLQKKLVKNCFQKFSTCFFQNPHHIWNTVGISLVKVVHYQLVGWWGGKVSFVMFLLCGNMKWGLECSRAKSKRFSLGIQFNSNLMCLECLFLAINPEWVDVPRLKSKLGITSWFVDIWRWKIYQVKIGREGMWRCVEGWWENLWFNGLAVSGQKIQIPVREVGRMKCGTPRFNKLRWVMHRVLLCSLLLYLLCLSIGWLRERSFTPYFVFGMCCNV